MQLIWKCFVICLALITQVGQISCHESKQIHKDSHEVKEYDLVSAAGESFYIGEDPKSWFLASEACANMKMALISLQDEEKERQVHDFLIARGLGDAYIWSSGTKELGEWVWSGVGEPLSHTSWYPGEPNGDTAEACLQFQANYGWFDLGCEAQHVFMCEEVKIKPIETPPFE